MQHTLNHAGQSTWSKPFKSEITSSTGVNANMIDIMTSQKFSLIIEDTVIQKRLSYMDAIVWWCEQNEMEIETAAKLLNGVIKEKIKVEAQDLNYLEKSARLPI
jgi:hypothetical protein